MTDPTEQSQRDQLEDQYEKGLISRQEYYERKRVLISQQEFPGPKATIAKVGRPSPPFYAPSASSVVVLGVVILILGSILFGANVDNRFLAIVGLLGVIVGTLLLGAGVIAYGVRVGVMQAYSRMGLTGPVHIKGDEDRD